MYRYVYTYIDIFIYAVLCMLRAPRCLRGLQLLDICTEYKQGLVASVVGNLEFLCTMCHASNSVVMRDPDVLAISEFKRACNPYGVIAITHAEVQEHKTLSFRWWARPTGRGIHMHVPKAYDSLEYLGVAK